MKISNVVGIMSGTSLDACDFVLCNYNFKNNSIQRFSVLDQAQVRFPKELLGRLTGAVSGKAMTAAQWSLLNFDLGQFYAQSLLKIKNKRGWSIHLIGLHGQTVFHSAGRATWQMGSPTFLAAQLGVPVVYDFRSLDVSMGYHGAPLAPLFHAGVLAGGVKQKKISIHNLGGVSNLTYIDNQKIKYAFDTGPANLLLDQIIQNYTNKEHLFDPKGSWARKGNIHMALAKKALSHNFFKKQAPKSCGRDEFGLQWIASWLTDINVYDALATATYVVTQSIVDSYKNLKSPLPGAIYFCGGGAKNLFLLESIQKQMPQVLVTTTQAIGDSGFDPQSIEGAAFGYLAALRYHQVKINLKNITGNNDNLFVGQIYQK